MRDFRELRVWEKAHQIALLTYKATHNFPSEERFGLTAQMRRCAVSIPSNIAEGAGRRSDADFGRFLQIAFGSASELEYQTLLSRDLNLLMTPEADDLSARLDEVKRMLSALIKKLTADS